MNHLNNIKKGRVGFYSPSGSFLRALLHEHFCKDLTPNISEPNGDMAKSRVTKNTTGRSFRVELWKRT